MNPFLFLALLILSLYPVWVVLDWLDSKLSRFLSAALNKLNSAAQRRVEVLEKKEKDQWKRNYDARYLNR